MSKQQPTRNARQYDFWGGRPLRRTASDLFFDRPRPVNTIFSGPNALWDQRNQSRELIGDVGEGEASALRSLDLGYLTRGYAIDPPLRRAAFPGEIGWTATYFHRQFKPTKPYTNWYT
ncbi:unnamed protein product [Rotaria socialis]|uniref:Uncharacterized protein n=1 Tax=Rotaria socialis TaxID=392032 RepID=A0A819WXM1_9BILA|nr:unnamed protein product [Rotaria socialis]CAF3436790.1 unnamed protein product [Rotaria socialis]CAF3455200.1 unnamed protein product [Rotaria socialis]CAF3490852.1 unnamed protein product [Rotaria socialis]CAF3630046.1 unnamed protein product [Rotaria socialis]